MWWLCQCITGAIIGVGMMEGHRGVNWRFLAMTFGSWAATILVMAVGTGVIVLQAREGDAHGRQTTPRAGSGRENGSRDKLLTVC